MAIPKSRCFALAFTLAVLVWPGSRFASAQDEKKVITNSIGMVLVPINPGKFKMGAKKAIEKDKDDGEAKEKDKEKVPKDEGARFNEDEHEVEISRPFYMGKFEVTQEEYQKVMGTNPSHFKGPKLPVEKVSWNDAKEFCAKLSRLEDRIYTLPTEAEWEYCCRAGTQSAFSFGDTITAEAANYDGNTVYPAATGKKGEFRNKTTTVGSFPPNPWGLHDMHGNVWEWCEDWWGVFYYVKSPPRDPPGPDNGNGRIMRGGSWFYDAANCRSSYRTGARPEIRSYNIGFRVVLRPGKAK